MEFEDVSRVNENGDVSFKSESKKESYNQLKQKLRYLTYENEFFQENLRQNQKKLLKINRDRSYLLDRLLKYEPVESNSEDSAVEYSEEEGDMKKKKPNLNSSNMSWNLKNNEELNNPNRSTQDDHLELVEKHLLARNETQIPSSFSFPRDIFEETDEV